MAPGSGPRSATAGAERCNLSTEHRAARHPPRPGWRAACCIGFSCNVTAMPTHVCAVCETVIPADVAGVQSPVTISRRRNGRGPTLRRVICQACASTYRAESPDGRRRASFNSRRVEQVNCVVCGLPVLLPVDKRRRVDACSDLCRSRFYAKPVEPVVTVCEGCGSDMTGRSDLRFCCPACRQRAYRHRCTANVSSES